MSTYKFSTVANDVEYGSMANNHANNIAYNYNTNTAYVVYSNVSSVSGYDIYVASTTDFNSWQIETIPIRNPEKPNCVSIAVDEVNNRICVAWATINVSYSFPYSSNIQYIIRDSNGNWGYTVQVTDYSEDTLIHDILVNNYNEFVFIYKRIIDYMVCTFYISIEGDILPVGMDNSALAITPEGEYTMEMGCIIDKSTNILRYVYSTYWVSDRVDIIEGSFNLNSYYCTYNVCNLMSYDMSINNISDFTTPTVELNMNKNGDILLLIATAPVYDFGGIYDYKYSADIYYKLVNGDSWGKLAPPMEEQNTNIQPHLSIVSNKAFLYYYNISYELVRCDMDGVNGTFSSATTISLTNHSIENVSVIHYKGNSIELVLFADSYSGINSIITRSDTSYGNMPVLVTVGNISNILVTKDSDVIVILNPPTITSVYKSGSSIFIVWEQGW